MKRYFLRILYVFTLPNIVSIGTHLSFIKKYTTKEVIRMPPTMARPRTFSKKKQQKGEPLAKSQTSRDTDWNVGNYMNMPGKNRRGLKKKESNQGKSESTALTALNSSMNSGATRIKKDTSSSQELDKGSKDSKEQENKKKIVLSDEAINQMITISNLMTEVKDSIHENIKEINNHEDTLLELEYSANNLERICSNSQLIWKIDDFRHKYSEAVSGKNSTLYSAPFETHKYGYKLALSFCPFGDGRAKGKYASLFFCVLRTDYDALLPWPFAHKLTFSIIDQREIPPYTPANKIQREDYVMEFTPNPIKENQPFVGRPTGLRNSSLGLPRFIPIDQLRNEKYLIDDAIYIRVQIHLDNVPKL